MNVFHALRTCSNIDFNIKLNYFNCIFIHQILLLLLTQLNEKTLASVVSKCYHEGDFSVHCNKSKLPSSDTIELMRFARVIQGMYHNDTLCSYTPNSGCYRKKSLENCIDKPVCQVQNGWNSLEPDCSGNSYYTQFEYDCQPAFYMCDKNTVINNAFSGLIYSPSFPNTFRSDNTEPCYLTIHLPKNHHVEITLDYFDMLKTSKCVGDYVEIQQYKEVSNTPSDDQQRLVNHQKRVKKSTENNTNSNQDLKFYYNEHDSGEIEYRNTIIDNNNNKMPSPIENSNEGLSNMKKRNPTTRQHSRRPKYKWQTLGTMCGRIDKAYTIRATADTINFKFRPLPSSHPYLATLANYSKSSHQQYATKTNQLGFKIYFQAIPPRASYDSEEDLERAYLRRKTTSSTSKSATTSSDSNDSSKISSKPNSNKISLWLLILVSAGAAFILLTILTIVLIIFIKKRRVGINKSSAAADTSSYSKTASSNYANANNKKTSGKKDAHKSNKLAGEDSDDSSMPKVTPAKITTTPKPTETSASVSTKPTASTSVNKTKVFLEPEPRKMQAERPMLLQDLSQSKLLMKYKKENPDSAASTAVVVENTNKNDVNEENANKTAETNETELNKNPNKSSIKSDSNNSGVYDGTLSNTKGPVSSSSTQNFKTVLNNSGVYDGGASNPTDDNSGIYGVDLISVQQTSVKRVEKKKSIDESQVAKNELKVNSNKKKTPSESAKSSRRSSTQSRNKPNDAKEESEKERLLATKGIDEVSQLAESRSAPNRKNSTANSNEKNNEVKQNEIDLLNETIKSSNLKDGGQIATNDLNSKSVDMSVTSSPPGFLTSTPRKAAFNPLHVILKDKNKYHTTEYI